MMVMSMKMKLMGFGGECSHRYDTASKGGKFDDGEGDGGRW